MFAVVMAGGSGTRFWPRSRKRKPKQLITLHSEKTMIQETVARVAGLIPPERTFAVTNALQADELGKQLLDIPAKNIIVEPFGRNTAPCIGLAALYLKAIDRDAVMVVLPADHIVKKEKAFLGILSAAEEFLQTEKQALITLGIPPSSPHTGYGYINSGKEVMSVGGVSFFKVKGFREKPDKETAEEFLADGNYLWNSGTFVWRASTILDMTREHIPEMYSLLMEFEKHIGTNREQEGIKELYNAIPSVSIDVGIMEKSKQTIMIKADIGWSDVGSWSAMDDIYPHDKNKNIYIGDHIAVDSTGCVVFSPNKTVALVGVEDIVVVETDDALLVCRKSQSEKVKQVTEILKQKGKEELL